ncbi:MAG: hypothetical protein L6290_00385 [Thermodesulfovibrionales bacterium]|nr:hypothetical protein [Thermodesulfovibrionales bacterium]
MRYDFARPVAYTLKPRTHGDFLIALSSDISSSGLGLRTDCLLEEGQEIVIKSDIPFSGRSAVVRWSREIREGLFKSGLEVRG